MLKYMTNLYKNKEAMALLLLIIMDLVFIFIERGPLTMGYNAGVLYMLVDPTDITQYFNIDQTQSFMITQKTMVIILLTAPVVAIIGFIKEGGIQGRILKTGVILMICSAGFELMQFLVSSIQFYRWKLDYLFSYRVVFNYFLNDNILALVLLACCLVFLKFIKFQKKNDEIRRSLLNESRDGSWLSM